MAELRFGIFSPQKSGYIFNSVHLNVRDFLKWGKIIKNRQKSSVARV